MRSQAERSGKDCSSTLPKGTFQTLPDGAVTPWQPYSFIIFKLLILYMANRGTLCPGLSAGLRFYLFFQWSTRLLLCA